ERALTRAASALAGRERAVAGDPIAGSPEGGGDPAGPAAVAGPRRLLGAEAAGAAAVSTVVGLVRPAAAEPVELTAEARDRAVALTSRAPQVLASVLQAAAAELGAHAAAGPGFASATRVAGGSAEIWQDIFASNADEVCWALQQMIGELEGVVARLKEDPPNTEGVMAVLARARRARRLR